MAVLIIYLHATTSFPNMTFNKFNNLSKRFCYGLAFMYIFLIYIPLLSRYSYTFASWYLIASGEIPLLQTTMDGPLLIILLSTLVFISLKFKYKNVFEAILLTSILMIGFYTLLVFNRRTIILMFLLLPFYILLNKQKGNAVPWLLFIGTFLVPLNFLLIIKYAASISNTSLFVDLMGRSNDLNDKNGRLAGWILATNAYTNDFSFSRDFFGYHANLIRNTDERYNHFHNGFIQLYYEQGIFGFTTTVALLIQLVRRVKYFKLLDLKRFKYTYIFVFMFTVLLILLNTESIFRKTSIFCVFFVICAFFIIKLSNQLKRTITVAITTTEDEVTTIEDVDSNTDTSNKISK
ncbi:O-antigen ligase family protein [Mucilaginibacter segetis]|uniref:O-antigen ligase n=1 Tax=Mucilaginibacter segetis TaxID=2793071 RepID=A0A934UP19_9SPHI|nr:hypothetical protein [Mucilaginibacter segetis]MBK0380680.1 hypothetical protein [Mucilaginibacter segetis]